MKLIKYIILIASILSFQTSFSQTKERDIRLDSLFTSLAAQNQFSGSVLIAEKGVIIYDQGKGYRDEKTQAKNNSTTIFELASCSKQFIGVGVALLHRAHKISYDDDLTKYLPELSNFKGVKIYDLLRHTSGIPEFLGKFRATWNKKSIATNADLIAYYSKGKDTLDFVPTSRYRYSNTNYVILASIIEKISHQTINNYLNETIFKPLQMINTFIYNRRESPKALKNYAYGYSWIKNSFEKATEDDPRINEMTVYYMDGIVGNAKVNSTVEDLYKWLNAIKHNSLLTQEEFDEVMRTSKTTDNKDVNYGFGFEVRKKDGSISYGHNGSWDGYSTFMHYNSAKDRTIIILNNFRNGVAPFKTINEILDNRPTSNELIKKTYLSEGEVRKYVGTYIDDSVTPQKHIITYLDGYLIYNSGEADWDMRFFPTSPQTFQAIRQGGDDGKISFTKKTNGLMELQMTQYGRPIGNGIRKEIKK